MSFVNSENDGKDSKFMNLKTDPGLEKGTMMQLWDGAMIKCLKRWHAEHRIIKTSFVEKLL